MTYLSAVPQAATTWDEICYPVESIMLGDLLPEYDIVASDRQQLIVGEPFGQRKTVFGIQSAGYTIIPNHLIRLAVDRLFTGYELQIKHTVTGEFSISIILAEELAIGEEHLRRSIIVTNGYNGKTPFSIQGRTLTSDLGQSAGSMYRALCQNGLVGWADSFADLGHYQNWLSGQSPGAARSAQGKAKPAASLDQPAQLRKQKGYQSADELELLLVESLSGLHRELKRQPALTAMVYEHLQRKQVTREDERILRSLPIPAQLARQAYDRMRIEQRLLGGTASYWLMYNAVNYALFTARSSLTLNDRYKLDERVFHQLAAMALS